MANNDLYVTSALVNKLTEATNKEIPDAVINPEDLITTNNYEPYIKAEYKTMPVVNRMIWVSFQKEGIHKYPAALTDPKLNTGDEYDVSFLGYPHRHTFYFRVAIEVEHNDRDIEFIQFKRWLTKLYDSAILELDYRSCEMIAEELYDQIAERYPGRTVEIEVSEDNENGCKYKWEQNND